MSWDDDDLRAALRDHRTDGADVATVRASIERGIARRRRIRHAAATAGAAVAVTGAVLAPQLVRGAPDAGSDQVAGGPVTTTSPTGTTPPVEPTTAAPSVEATEEPVPATAPSSGGDAPSHLDDLVAGFYAAGYEYDDALVLADLWREDSWYTVKALAGQQLADGRSLPIAPGGQPAEDPQPISQSDLGIARWEEAGYTFADATALAEVWNVDEVVLVKALGGQRLLDGLAIEEIIPP